jgi:hypothetical protein
VAWDSWQLRCFNRSLTISEHNRIPPGLYPSGGVSDMSLHNARPELNPLFAFTLTIAGAIAVGLPMAIVIIWICS